jgi:hypothetical protein
MPVLGNDEMVVAVSENGGVSLRIIAPFSGRTGVGTVMITAVNSLGTAVAGGFSTPRSTAFQGGTVAGDFEILKIRKKSGFDGGHDTNMNEQILQNFLEIIRAGLIAVSKQLFG